VNGSLVPAFKLFAQVLTDVVKLLSALPNLSRDAGSFFDQASTGAGSFFDDLARRVFGPNSPLAQPIQGGAVINQTNNYYNDPNRTNADDLRMAQLVAGGTR
jgi:hypothetical protein